MKLYKGSIVENSLKDKGILNQLEITSTKHADDWIIHDVLINEDQVSEIGKYINSGPWYMHFWLSGSNEVKVVFNDKIFTIDYSDKSTWLEAIKYGKEKGIPEEQLDFLISK